MPEDDDQSQTDLVPRSHIKGLEEKAARVDELQNQLNAIQRDSAFAKALGTSTAEPWYPFFEKGYDGELTPDAIRDAAVNAGFGAAPQATPTQEGQPTAQIPQPPDLAAHQRMAAAAVGAAPPPLFNPIEAIAKANSAEEVMAIVEAHGEKYGVISSRLAQ